jgi:hypothetical protein
LPFPPRQHDQWRQVPRIVDQFGVSCGSAPKSNATTSAAPAVSDAQNFIQDVVAARESPRWLILLFKILIAGH